MTSEHYMTIKGQELQRILEEYYPRISYTRALEIRTKIFDLEQNKGSHFSSDLKVTKSEVHSILRGYYPQISHKTAGRIVQSIEIASKRKEK